MANISPLFPVTVAPGMFPVRLWVFPGQGSQAVGMGKALYDSSSAYRDAFDRGHEALFSREGVDLRRLVFEGPKDELTRTLHAQPALLVSNYAFLEHLRAEEGIEPQPGDLMAGHSLGEWTAYVASGALTIEQGALAVYWRGRLMEGAFPFDPATRPMTAILGLPDDAVIAGCAGVHREGHVVVAANFNAPGQVIISGHPAAVAEASELLKSRGARTNNDFPVAGPFHTPILNDAREQLGAKIEELGITFGVPKFQIISNFTAREIASDGNHLQSLLNQLTGSVRWSASMLRAWELGAVQMVSVDVSGKVLQTFASRIFSHAVPVQTVDPTIPMHRHALKVSAGTIRTTVFAPAPDVATRRLLEFSYNATAVVREIQTLMARGETAAALAILDNRYHIAREAGMRALRKFEDRPEVIAAMREHGFVNTTEGALVWPEPVVRDLPTHPLPEAVVAELTGPGKDPLFAQLAALGLSPIEPEDLAYYVASRWGGEEKRLEEILKRLRRIAGLNALKLALTKYKDENGEEQKGIGSWEQVVLYVDTDKEIAFKHPGVMTQGDIA